MQVGIRELKLHLSHYLDRAAAGERIAVTDRGRLKALVVPVPGGDDVQRGLSEGWITAPEHEGTLPARPQRARARATIFAILDEDRGA